MGRSGDIEPETILISAKPTSRRRRLSCSKSSLEYFTSSDGPGMVNQMLLVFGSNGQLASSLKSTSLGAKAVFLGSKDADFANSEALGHALQSHRPRLIINTSAYTRVDAAESDRELCQKVNAEALSTIGAWARAHDASVVHFSTDYVFPGTGENPWKEEDSTGPVNWYGETKLLGEKHLRSTGCHAVTFRTSWLFSEHGTNFVKTMLRLGKSSTHLNVVADQIGNPTYATDIAEFLERILPRIEAREVEGTFHLSNSGSTSWHQLAEYVFARAAENGHALRIKSVAPIPSAQYPTPAKRPMNGRLCPERLKRTFGCALPDWRDAVDRCLSKMEID